MKCEHGDKYLSAPDSEGRQHCLRCAYSAYEKLDEWLKENDTLNPVVFDAFSDRESSSTRFVSIGDAAMASGSFHPSDDLSSFPFTEDGDKCELDPGNKTMVRFRRKDGRIYMRIPIELYNHFRK